MVLKDKEIKSKLIDIEREGRLYLIEKLKENNYQYYYGEGNYIFIKPKNNKRNVIEKMYNKKILIKNYNKGILKDYIRINTGSVNVMKKFFDIFIAIDQDEKNI